jgi:hypothetical protein
MHPTPAPRLRLGARIFAVFASLRLAIVLLSLFTCCLAAATLIESRYDGRIAADLVYRAWWFVVLLAGLAANVLCAALKKYPWKRHQVGFLITHAGLLILLSGGVLTALGGVEGQMVLVDTSNQDLQQRIGLSNRAETIYLADSHRIEVYRLKRPAAAETSALIELVRAIDRGEEVSETAAPGFMQTWSWTFRPGPFAWHPEEKAGAKLPRWLRLLQLLAAPFPEMAWDLDDGTLSVDNFFPGEVPVIRCTLICGTRKKEFQVGLSRPAARVLLGDELYLVRYRPDVRPVGFALTLHRARQHKGPGTDRPAAFQSDVSMTWPGSPTTQEHRIVMNQPLSAGGYKVFQANYRVLIDPTTEEPLLDGNRPVSLSGLSVARDPGLWLKYAGSLIVVLGITTMFWMKAYFFRPRSLSA